MDKVSVTEVSEIARSTGVNVNARAQWLRTSAAHAADEASSGARANRSTRPRAMRCSKRSEQLASTLKAENLVAASTADAADVFGAQAAGHRHRAQFARSGDELPVRLCQFDAKLREQVDASLPVLSRPIAAAAGIERMSAEATPPGIDWAASRRTARRGASASRWRTGQRRIDRRTLRCRRRRIRRLDGGGARAPRCARRHCNKRLSLGGGVVTGSCAARRRLIERLCSPTVARRVGSARGPVLQPCAEAARTSTG